MHSLKNYGLAFLALTTVAGAALAWKQYQELVKLRAAALNTDADWQKRLHSADQQRADLEAKVASLQKKPDDAGETPAEDPASDRNGFGRRGGRSGKFRELMERPEMQKLVAVEQKARLDSRYAGLFKSLGLTPEQLDKFKNLLVEKRTSMMDVMSAAREQGINPRSDPDAFHKLVSDAQAEIDNNIRSVLGDAGFSQYQNYEQTLPERGLVDQLQQRLSYSSTPLTDAQAEQMVQILAATTGSGRTGANGVPVALTAFGSRAASLAGFGNNQITDTAINQSLGVLAGPQVDALKELQQEQQAQAQMNAAIREQFRNQRSNNEAAPPPPPNGG
ncbi:MAG TPA: hypothetical protein VHE13_05760 [Opitutus sp.]|nr:hypothetical protein [Opitutus sp.]